MPGKRIHDIKIRLDDKLLNALALMANRDERALAEYLYHELYHLAFGKVCSVYDTDEECEQKRRG